MNPPIIRVHVAYAARTGPASLHDGPRDSRIVVSTAKLDAAGMTSGGWLGPVALDNARSLSDPPNAANPPSPGAPMRGQQFYPSMAPTSVGGKVAVSYYDTRDDSVTAGRQVIEVAAARRRTQRVARNPARQSGQLGGICRQMISAAQLQAGKPVNFVNLFNHHAIHPDIWSVDGTGGIQES